MAQAQGWNTYLGLGEEGTWGTAVTRTKFYRIRSEGLERKQEQMPKDLLGTRSQFAAVKSKISVEGSFQTPWVWNGTEYLLKHGMGTLTTGAPNYTHTITLASSLPTGMTLEIARDVASIGTGNSFVYEGCMMNKLTLTQELEDFLLLDCEVLGQTCTKGNITAASFDAWDPGDWTMVTTATLGGTSMKVRKFTIEIDNNLFGDKYTLVGGRERTGIIPGGVRKVSGSFEVEYAEATLHDLYWALSNNAISIVFTSGSQTLTISIPKAYLSGTDPVVGGPDPVYMTLPFQGFLNSADGDELSIVSFTTAALS